MYEPWLDYIKLKYGKKENFVIWICVSLYT